MANISRSGGYESQLRGTPLETGVRALREGRLRGDLVPSRSETVQE